MEKEFNKAEEVRAIRMAWEELLGYAKQLKEFSGYLSMEQQRELESLREQIRLFERNLKSL